MFCFVWGWVFEASPVVPPQTSPPPVTQTPMMTTTNMPMQQTCDAQLMSARLGYKPPSIEPKIFKYYAGRIPLTVDYGNTNYLNCGQQIMQPMVCLNSFCSFFFSFVLFFCLCRCFKLFFVFSFFVGVPTDNSKTQNNV